MQSASEIDEWLFAQTKIKLSKLVKTMSRGVPGTVELHHGDFNRGRHGLNLEFRGTENCEDVWKREIEIFPNEKIYGKSIYIRNISRGIGIGRILERNTRDAAILIKAGSIEAHAVNGGSYLCAQLGFLPSIQGWELLRKRLTELAAKVEDRFPCLSDMATLRTCLASRNPKLIRNIAMACTSPIPSTLVPCAMGHAGDEYLPLGKALLSSDGISWRAKFEINTYNNVIFDGYVSRARLWKQK